jgi:hypothetical protein
MTVIDLHTPATELVAADLLEDEAARWETGDPLPPVARRIADPRLDAGDLTELWAYYAETARARDQLLSCPGDWRLYYTAEELGCGDHQETAIDLKAAEADWARTVIQFGHYKGDGR